MSSVKERQEKVVARMKQSPCQCLTYHPKLGTEIYMEYLEEWRVWRNLPRKLKGNSDKDWILIWLAASQSCPWIVDERKSNEV